ncbi:MAG TPA: trans-aconitate 2-methyltransferase [Ideonella sp.]|nr:trans-aconitate 2-methyltransferase [Ideonella sp.]
MSEWNPALYRQFEDERTRPARELLARVPLATASLVYDLGCGPGNSTELLIERFPRAQATGTDSSQAMLDSARERLPDARFEFSDIATWQPARAPDLIYANASLQWVRGHETLYPRLFAALAPGGVLAVQVPDNLDQASHRLMREVAGEAPWAASMGDIGAVRSRVLAAGAYYDLLARDADQVDVWHTVYQHPMASAGKIVEWLRSTGLRPFLDKLTPELQASYLAEYEHRIDQAYPMRSDGQRLLAFPRLFVVARRKP